MEIPEFPLRGKDIIASGVKNPHQIGPILKELEEIWIGSGFKLSKQELLDIRDKFKKSPANSQNAIKKIKSRVFLIKHGFF